MSIEAVVGRVQAILTAEQQLANPAAGSAPTATAPAAPAAAPSSVPAAPTGTGGTSFSDALATAQSQSAPTGAPNQRVQAMIGMADSLLGKPYVWGGGHSGFVSNETSLSGFDCSGFVSAVLHAGGYLSTPQTTDTLPGQPGIVSGPGQYVTIYDRTGSGGHVIIDIGGQFYESGGGSGSRSGGVEGGLSGGVAKIGRPSDSYLATFGTILHPEGL
jgi:cell wall-associated NlpC family hydrolase